MGWFFRQKTEYAREMRECLKEFMLSYIKDNPVAADDVVPIFSDAELILRRFSEKEIAKTMRANNVNVECCALNILQNVAMHAIKQQSATNFLKGYDRDYAYELYKHVNDLKLEKGYISKQQYEENDLVATKMAIKSPLSNWF